ncbi:MAG TPA: ATP-binding protein [Terriglobales bacterium]|nr:ATP-binding protein [Terriglobales bacterium]
MGRQALLKAGTKVSRISVEISYRIIDLFSAGLYSSPNKALEELVSNSYDALATSVEVIIPSDVQSPEAVIWVLDDGESMDVDAFADLWQIASSKKREKESKNRPPIGKFGIGKLATYVLARELTYVTKAGGKYHAVTMDFAKIDPDTKAGTRLSLDVRQLTEAEAKSAVAPLPDREGAGSKALPLFGRSAPKTWTVAAMSNLTALAQSLETGRLRWVLETALPLSPRFNLYFNGDKLQPSKSDLTPLKQWVIGDSDSAKELSSSEIEAKKIKKGLHLAGIGPISGVSELFADPLGGKSDKWGRSNGIFVSVRGRLINIDDGLFGLPALSHGPFSRWRMEVKADGLDVVLRSTREAVLETTGVKELRRYILHKFNQARSFYNQWLAEWESSTRFSTRIGQTSASLSRRPLFNAIRAAIESGSSNLFLTKVPLGLSKSEKAKLIAELDREIDSEKPEDLFIRDVEFDALGPQYGVALFDVAERRIRINTLHPFFANYAEHYKNPEPFVLLASTEVLTEGFMHDQGISAEVSRLVLEQRDRFLRQLVYSRPVAAPLVAQMLRDTVSSPDGLEDAAYRGFRTLGFEVTKLGGKGKPDGVGYANLGVREDKNASYTFTYDTKSTGKDRVQAHTVGSGTLARHRDKYNAQYAIAVARDVAGRDDPESAINQEAKGQRITILTVDDFARLVLVASTRQLGRSKIRSLFETCHTPNEVRRWIDGILAAEPPEWPLPEILQAIDELQKEGIEVVRFSAIRVQSPKLRNYREKDLEGWVNSAAMLAGGYMNVVGDVVTLDAPPDKILSEIRRQSDNLPAKFRPEAMIAELERNPLSVAGRKGKKAEKRR